MNNHNVRPDQPARTWTSCERAQLALLAVLVAESGVLWALAWRGADEIAQWRASQRQDFAQLRDELRKGLHALGNRVAPTGTDHLCPVQFHFRFDSLHSIPAIPLHRELERSDGALPEPLRGVSQSGMIDFGLVTPGQYRLTVTRDDGYRLEHRCVVSPGVAVNQLINCPGSARWYSHADSFLRIERPASLRDRELYLLCRFEQDDADVNGWTWTPVERSAAWAVVVPEDGAAAPLAELWNQTGRLESEVSTTLPFRYARVTCLAAFRPSRAGDQPDGLVTLVFGAHGPEAVAGIESPPAVRILNQPPPRIVSQPEDLFGAISIELPSEGVTLLETALADADRSQASDANAR